MQRNDSDRRFVETILEHYRTNGRHDLPWRQPELDGSFDPYKILVSELMLQQTQVARVIPKYEAFLRDFPSAQSLANAELGDVLRAWQGLGYNRRAKYLWQAARMVTAIGTFPDSVQQLVTLPGVGVNTAGAVLAYAFNRPVLFVETNIRTVYIHHFTRDGEIVSDDFIRDQLKQTLDYEHPREFFWALMDYGAWLKTQVRNTAQSNHYVRQPKFQGSRRQIRGHILRLLSERHRTEEELQKFITDERLQSVLQDLRKEGLVRYSRKTYSL